MQDFYDHDQDGASTPAAQGVSATGEALLWEGHPSPRSLIPALLLAGGFAWMGYFHLATIILQPVIDVTAFLIAWDKDLLMTVWHATQALFFLPLLLGLLKLLTLRLTRYSLTSERLLYSRGLLLRRQDQIWLQRIRDFRIAKPLGARLTGTGYITLVSRDETLPRLDMGPFARCDRIEELVRQAVVARQSEVGYREVETT